VRAPGDRQGKAPVLRTISSTVSATAARTPDPGRLTGIRAALLNAR
jgi:hypothetical protein